MASEREVEQDMQVQLACQKDQPYIRLITFLGAITLALALFSLLFRLVSSQTILAMVIIGMALGMTGLAWSRQDKAKLEAIQHKHDKDDEEEDLGMRMSSYE